MHARTPPMHDPRFRLDDPEPLCRKTWKAGRLKEKMDAALRELQECRACPRDCGVPRLSDALPESGRRPVCNTGRHAVVSSAFPHFGEEDCLRGWRGSGTIFFSLCNLRCVFCQNWDISQQRQGRLCTGEEIAGIMLDLQEHGCHNINFVTPEHVVPQVVEAIAHAVPMGLRVPVVYNTSAYDAVPSLRVLEGLVDVYMPDFKFWEQPTARDLARAKDYPERAREAIAEMHRQVGPLRFGPDGLARRGVLVRHLVMPGQEREARRIFRWLAESLGPDTYVNVMAQYRPDHRVGAQGPRGPRHPEIDRRPGRDELHAARAAAQGAGLWRLD